MGSVAADHYVNGVFKGGGAKGVAYAGALEALAARRVWFKSVAGASAGAITAALIAADYGPEEIAKEVPKALNAARSSIPIALVKAVAGRRTSIFEAKGLRTWLNRALATKCGLPEDHLVTFEELRDRFGIELYVVVLDLATASPVVFCARTTPHVEVAGAVASSAAIPAAFPVGRGVFSTAKGAVVHQFVDGGAWANYPSFVFEDGGFRTWLTGSPDDEEAGRPVVGFILGEPRAVDRTPPIGMVPLGSAASGGRISKRFDLGQASTGRSKPGFVVAATIANPAARIMIAVALVAWVTLNLVVMPVAFRRFAAWLTWVPEIVYPVVLVVTCTILVLAAAAAVTIVGVLLAAGRLIGETLIPSMTAIMGVPTDVPPWLGLGTRSVVIEVPYGRIGTTQFALDKGLQLETVTLASAAVAAQLDGDEGARLARLLGIAALPEPSSRARRVVPSPAAPAVAIHDDQARMKRLSLVGLGVAVGIAGIVAGLGWWNANTVGTDRYWTTVLLLLAGFVAVAGGLWFFAARVSNRSSSRALFAVRSDNLPGRALGYLGVAIGAVLVVAGLVVTDAAMSDRSDTRVLAKVVSASEDAGTNRYSSLADGVTIEFDSDRHLRLGERVFLDISGTPELTGPVDDPAIPIGIFLAVLGLGLLSSGIKWVRWARRCRHLAQQVAAWEPGVPLERRLSSVL